MVNAAEFATKRVGVLLPAYNAGRFIGETIHSVLAQSYGEFELLIFDNASDDDTAAVIASFDDPRINYHRNEVNLGFHGNVNLALSATQAPYVVVMNADDIWERNYLQSTVDFLDCHSDVVFVHTRAIWINEAGEAYGGSPIGCATLSEPRETFLSCLSEGFCFASMLMRREYVQKLWPIPATEPWKRIVDSWLFLKLALMGPVGFINEPLIRYRVHDDSVSFGMYADGSFFRRHLASVREAFSWPEAGALGLRADERKACEKVALASIHILPVIRIRSSAVQYLRIWRSIVLSVPTVARYPAAWARLCFGLLPAPVISALRNHRQRRWRASNPTRKLEFKSDELH